MSARVSFSRSCMIFAKAFEIGRRLLVYTLPFPVARKLSAIVTPSELHETNLHYHPQFLHGRNFFNGSSNFGMQSQLPPTG